MPSGTGMPYSANSCFGLIFVEIHGTTRVHVELPEHRVRGAIKNVGDVKGRRSPEIRASIGGPGGNRGAYFGAKRWFRQKRLPLAVDLLEWPGAFQRGIATHHAGSTRVHG